MEAPQQNYSRDRYSLEEKVISFWSRVDRSGGPDACWNWQGAVTAKWGYGCFGVGPGITRGAHKLAWLFTHGDPQGLCILHRCDNRLCCNPAHLFLGTKQDNSDDKMAKGRHPTKLTVEQVREIRAAVAPYGDRRLPKGLLPKLIEKYGIAQSTFHGIRTGQKWRHVK